MSESGVSTVKPLTIALVAGESSGDNLGAPLMQSIRRDCPNVRFIGIGGPAMIEEGLECWTDLDRLSVNGFVDPIKRLPELIRILISTRNQILKADVDCFIGVDFNFFNLLLERMLKSRGVKTVHYVSPTVWAWRKGRIKSIAKSVDLMLTLYPFETAIYEQHGISVAFVGHPKADEIDPDGGEVATFAAKEALGLGREDRVVAILPGSRGSEVKFTGPDFFRAANRIVSSRPDVRFVVPAANRARRNQIEILRAEICGQLDIKVIDGQSTLAMQAADVVLVNSGTATL
ncbi:MAG: lipid-A-disaccharide synthase, partial [Pseudomonadales bacterium]